MKDEKSVAIGGFLSSRRFQPDFSGTVQNAANFTATHDEVSRLGRHRRSLKDCPVVPLQDLQLSRAGNNAQER